MNRRILWSALALGLATAVPQAMAAEDPQAFIGGLGDQAISVMGPSVPLDQRLARFHQLFRADFAGGQIGQFVLGRYSRTLTPEQRQQFQAVFEDAIVEAYAKRFGDYAGQPFRVTGTRQTGAETVVSSQVVRQGGAPVTIEWSVVDENGQPKITDVTIGGASMRVQERELFGRLMQQSGDRVDIALAAFRHSGSTTDTATRTQ